MASPNAPLLRQEIRVVGQLIGMKAGATATIRLMEGREIEGPLAPSLMDERREISSIDIALGTTWIQVAGVGCFDHAEKLLKMEEITLLERLDVRSYSILLRGIKTS